MARVSRVLAAVLLIGWVNLAGAEVSTLEFIESLGKPKVMEAVGNSHLDITTKNKKAQQFFDQGLSLLHDFWYFESYRSFLHASTLDAESPMPHWGIYYAAGRMANLKEDERKTVLGDAVAAMKRLRDNASERERYYMLELVFMQDEAIAWAAKQGADLR